MLVRFTIPNFEKIYEFSIVIVCNFHQLQQKKLKEILCDRLSSQIFETNILPQKQNFVIAQLPELCFKICCNFSRNVLSLLYCQPFSVARHAPTLQPSVSMTTR